MTFAQYNVGSPTAGQQTLAMLPKNWKFDGSVMGVMYCHGAGGDALECRNGYAQNMWTIMDAITAAGYPMVSCDLGGDLWGNSTAIADVTAAKNYLQGTLGAKSGRIGFIGQSMGHLSAMNWAAQNMASTAFVVTSMGVCDLNNIFGNSQYTASINAAYGGAYSNATYGATYNPAVNTSQKFNGLPWLSYRGSSDPVAPPSTAAALALGIGPTATNLYVGGAHDWTTVGNYPVADIITFIQAHT